MDTPELVAALEAGSLDQSLFNHRNHVRAAWHYLQALPLPEAAHRFCAVVQAYARGLGAEQKFHLTLSLALMHLIHQRLRPGQPWQAFEAANPELFQQAQALVARHYSAEALEQGRGRFVEPDRAALP